MHSGKVSACNPGDTRPVWFNPWVRKVPWKRKRQPTPVFLPGKFHGQRSLAGYCPWGCKGLNITEQLSTHILRARTPTVKLAALKCLNRWVSTLQGFYRFLPKTRLDSEISVAPSSAFTLHLGNKIRKRGLPCLPVAETPCSQCRGQVRFPSGS